MTTTDINKQRATSEEITQGQSDKGFRRDSAKATDATESKAQQSQKPPDDEDLFDNMPV